MGFEVFAQETKKQSNKQPTKAHGKGFAIFADTLPKEETPQEVTLPKTGVGEFRKLDTSLPLPEPKHSFLDILKQFPAGIVQGFQQLPGAKVGNELALQSLNEMNRVIGERQGKELPKHTIGTAAFAFDPARIAPEPATTAEKATRFVGTLLPETLGVGGAYGTLGKAAVKTLPKAGKLLQEGVRGATSFGGYEGLKAIGEGKSAGEVAKQAGIGAAIGGVGDVAIGRIAAPLAKRVGQAIWERLKVQSKPATAGVAGTSKVTSTKPEPTVEPGAFTLNVKELKDISGFRAYAQDVYRNFRDVFGKQYKKVKKAILDPFDEAKKANIEFQEKLLNELEEKIVKGLGITKGSKLSALVQRYGEKKITLEQLKSIRPKDWQKVVEADKWFRQKYDELLDKVNEVRREIYPNNPEKIIPKRKDYYRHFRELSETLGGLKNIFDTPANIDPKLVAVSEFTLPKTRWASFMQRRGMGPYKEDAVGGFLNYVPSASYAIHIDPHISNFESLAKLLAESTTETRHLNNFINFLRKFAQDLAGKTNPVDRVIQEIIPGGRMTFNAINWLNNRVKANTILGNAASALAQFGNVPQGIGFAKQYSIPGAGKTLLNIIDDIGQKKLLRNDPIKKSGFLKERFSSRMYDKFDTKLLQQPVKFAKWVLMKTDEIGSKFIWNSVYSKAVAEGITNPIKYADDITRQMVAGRGIGEVPLIQKSRLMQIVMPFQVEVGNLWHVQRDFVKAKDFGGLLTLYLAAFIFNKAMEATRGYGVVFDPIEAIGEALATPDLTLEQRLGRVAGEVLSNIPLGQSMAALYPEYGMTMFGREWPTRRELFGEGDPTRFGTGLLVNRALQNPWYKLIPPYAGGQLEKTAKGLRALKEEGVYTQDKKQLKYPIVPSLPNTVRGLLFGPSGFSETQEYYQNNRRPLSKTQTQAVKRSPNPQTAYEKINKQRRLESIERKIAEITRDKKLSAEEKRKEIEKLVRERNRVLKK